MHAVFIYAINLNRHRWKSAKEFSNKSVNYLETMQNFE